MVITSESKNTILVVDDSRIALDFLGGILREEGFSVVEAKSGLDALTKLEELKPDLILLDVLMPGMSGYEVCKRLKADPETRIVPVVFVSTLEDISDKVRGFEAGADDFLSKPVNRVEFAARVKSLIKINSLYSKLDNAENVIYALAKAVEAKDPYTEGHIERVGMYAVGLARIIGLSEDDQDILRKGGILHDIGKVGVKDFILNKPGKLTAEEFEQMKQHPVIGERICRSLSTTRDLLSIIRHHHEKLDGSGYPDGLKDREIPVQARIMAIVDVFDALTTDRPYRQALSHKRVVEILREETEKGWWDPFLTMKFIRMIENGYIDSKYFSRAFSGIKIKGKECFPLNLSGLKQGSWASSPPAAG